MGLSGIGPGKTAARRAKARAERSAEKAGASA
jgi:hypothetical protein